MIKRIMVALLCWQFAGAIEVGKVPPVVVLDGRNGSKVDGGAWRSDTLKGKVHIVFYVDPDERDTNEALAQALKKRRFDTKKVAPVAIINLAATWLPNIVLERLLKEKQKEFPNTLYVKDKRKVLVKRWQLADDASDILLFDKEGRLLYRKFGKVNEKEIAKVIAIIEKHL